MGQKASRCPGRLLASILNNVSFVYVKRIKQPGEHVDRDAGQVFCLDGCRQ
jgi:hypothetical protein